MLCIPSRSRHLVDIVSHHPFTLVTRIASRARAEAPSPLVGGHFSYLDNAVSWGISDTGNQLAGV